MPPAINVSSLDQYGVIVDTDAINNPEGSLTKAQNAIPDSVGEKGSIAKRPGLKAFNATAGAGSVTGGIPVPLYVGGAGPFLNNPWPDIPVSITALTQAVYTVLSPPTFDDFSFEFDFDIFDDYVEDPTLDPNLDPLTEIPDTFEILTVDTTQAALVPLDYFATIKSGGIVRLVLDQLCAQSVDNETTHPNTADLLFPVKPVRATSVSTFPYALNNWLTGGCSQNLDGYPTCVMDDAIFYVVGAK